uniref:Uncharacterized protein n=1 Tax=Tetraselmis sp. GSL018 TaxID=582737 RepID=A0A061S8Y0_9CHLO
MSSFPSSSQNEAQVVVPPPPCPDTTFIFSSLIHESSWFSKGAAVVSKGVVPSATARVKAATSAHSTTKLQLQHSKSRLARLDHIQKEIPEFRLSFSTKRNVIVAIDKSSSAFVTCSRPAKGEKSTSSPVAQEDKVARRVEAGKTLPREATHAPAPDPAAAACWERPEWINCSRCSADMDLVTIDTGALLDAEAPPAGNPKRTGGGCEQRRWTRSSDGPRTGTAKDDRHDPRGLGAEQSAVAALAGIEWPGGGIIGAKAFSSADAEEKLAVSAWSADADFCGLLLRQLYVNKAGALSRARVLLQVAEGHHRGPEPATPRGWQPEE